ncbi:MAG: hypothetical protein V1793_04160 [Pseudomonadota bacterium]
MGSVRKKFYGWLILALFVGSAGVWRFCSITGEIAQAAYQPHKVHVAFGFHVNLYHSFRGDTFDENGFGRDIRIIRHILRTLEKFNSQGVPVRASWDFDNLFSLQNLLPRYAPDILETIRQRVARGQDEVLLMSYNNGLASAMNRQELTDTVQWAISNPWGSGVRDLFGAFTPIVRPQEMMTTPGDFDIYKKAGVRAVALYYSAAPFDAFRVFSRALSREEAHNPLTYRNETTSEEILIIPTYNIADLVENISLRTWTQDLHDQQAKGVINRDVLIFINFDADSEYWSGMDLAWPLDRLPNTRGIEGLINGVQNLDYVKFTSLKDYLAGHDSAGVIRFQQDTADGSFDGYNSWSEKRYSTDCWTRIVAARRIYQGAKKVAGLLQDKSLDAKLSHLLQEDYLLRLKALSTTNFGMATPFVIPQREAAMKTLLCELDDSGSRIREALETASKTVLKTRIPPCPPAPGTTWVDTVLVVSPEETQGPGSSRFISMDKPVPEAAGDTLTLVGMDGHHYPLTAFPGAGDGSNTRQRFYIAGPRTAADGIYFLHAGSLPKTPFKSMTSRVSGKGTTLGNPRISVDFDPSGTLTRMTLDGKSMVEPGSLMPYFRYEGKRYAPFCLEARAIDTGNPGSVSVAMDGKWDGPDGRTLSQGRVALTFTLMDGLPYLFVDGQVRYPATVSRDVLKADAGGLARQMDLGWQEAAPAELKFLPRADRNSPVRVLKHNYLDVHTAYDLDYFRHSDQNLNLDSVNNHITAGYAGVAAGNQGLAVGMDESVASNFAFAPVKVRYHQESGAFSASINPFGTYSGKQYSHPTWGNRQGYEAALISGEQYRSAAPTFNGGGNRFSLMITCFSGDQVPDQVRQDLCCFANPALIFSLKGTSRTVASGRHPSVPKVCGASYDNGRVTLSWDGDEKDHNNYRVLIGTRPGEYSRSFRTRARFLTLDGLSRTLPFKAGQRLYAVIETSGPAWEKPVRTGEIRLDLLLPRTHSTREKIPLTFPLKVVWANLNAAVR